MGEVMLFVLFCFHRKLLCLQSNKGLNLDSLHTSERNCGLEFSWVRNINGPEEQAQIFFGEAGVPASSPSLIHTGDPLALLLLRGKEEAWVGRQQNLRLRQEIRIP